MATLGEPQLVRASTAGGRSVVYDFAEHITAAKCLLRSNEDGTEKSFDRAGEDSSGATFKAVTEAQTKPIIPKPWKNSIAAFTPHRQDQYGVTIAEYEVAV